MRDYSIRFTKTDTYGNGYMAVQLLPDMSWNEMMKLAYKTSERTGGSVTIIDNEGEDIIAVTAKIGENVA